MTNVLLYTGSAAITLWGIGHLIPTRSVVAGFGPIAKDNVRIITMEWIIEGLALCFLGLLVGIMTAVLGPEAPATVLVARLSAGMLLVLAVVSFLTGARTSILPMRLCPYVKSVVALLFLAGTVVGQDVADTIEAAGPLSFVRVHADLAGASHFEDAQVDLELVDYAPPAPPISVSDAVPAEGFVFLSSAVGWFGDFHPAPRRQFIFFLAGELEVEVSDGETRRFGPGSAVLLEDTSGHGHASRVVGEDRAYLVAVPTGAP